jgi:4-amino-4-deoxy-L-arabinose transferase-like glycosyltransferase
LRRSMTPRGQTTCITTKEPAATQSTWSSRLNQTLASHYTAFNALILALAFLNCFWRLSSSVISDLDEARYGVAASEMLRSHSVLIATYAGRPEYWNLKPPLGYWMQELAYRAFGPSVFALRVPAAICALIAIALTMRACRRWYDQPTALLAGLILTTCFGFISHHGARSGDLDSALTLILLIAVIQIPTLAESKQSRLLWAGMLGLGFLLKSFAILPFAVVTSVYLLWSRDWRRSRARDWLPALALLIGVIGAWVLARVWADGSFYFVHRMFSEDLLGRVARVMDDERTRPWSYLVVLLDRFAPWPLFILTAALLFYKEWLMALPRQAQLLLLWTLVPLVGFSTARTHHHWYLDPSYPGWSILAAAATVRLLRVAAPIRRTLLVSALMLGLVFCEARVLFRIYVTDRRPGAQAFLMSLQDHSLVSTNQIIDAQFPLSHSERFILQVIDGYRVVDADASPSEASGPKDDTHVVLLKWQQPPPRFSDDSDDIGPQVIAIGAGYLLMQAPAQLTVLDD